MRDVSLFFVALSIAFFFAERAFCNPNLTTDYQPYLIKAKDLLRDGRYNDAISVLEYINKNNPVPDLILLLKASAERGLGRFEESNNLLKMLGELYPASPFLKRARSIEARNNLSILEYCNGLKASEYESSLWTYVSSVRDYEVSIQFARYMKKRDIEKAKEIFLDVYKGNSRFSEDALKELSVSDITGRVLIDKASNYIKDMEYKKAEEILKKAITLNDKTVPGEEISKKVGYCLFMQKKYDSAAREYERAGDLYNAARSYFRKGDMEGFDRMLSKLLDMKDSRAGSLLLALATKKRREGNLKEALSLFERVKKEYKQLEEDALWGVAWAFYRNGMFSEACATLSDLKNRYSSRRYSYWLKKCNNILKGEENVSYSIPSYFVAPDFYSIIGYLNSLKGVYSIKATSEVRTRLTSLNGTGKPEDSSPELIRFTTLISLGFTEEAVSELIMELKTKKRPDIIVEASSKLQNEGKYRSAIQLALLIKEDAGNDSLRSVLYPLAFWHYVRETAEKFYLDPFLLLSVMREESRFEPEVRSSAGAVGLMQLMPSTAHRVGKRAGNAIKDNNDLKEVKTNITIGAYYLKELLGEFGSLAVAISAYNAGEEKVKEWLSKERYNAVDEFVEDIPYEETRNYVKRVLTTYINYYLTYRMLDHSP